MHRDAVRVVIDGGAVAVIHWRDDIATPRGPSRDIRPSRERIVAWAHQVGRPWMKAFTLAPFHRLEKRGRYPDYPAEWGGAGLVVPRGTVPEQFDRGGDRRVRDDDVRARLGAARSQVFAVDRTRWFFRAATDRLRQ